MGVQVGRERCAVAGCGRFVRLGAEHCGRHRVAGEEEEQRTGAVREFRERLARGEYRALFDPPLGEVLLQAAAERGLADEIGALRVAMARLLAEEEDASKMAVGIARIASVAIQAAKTQQVMSGEAMDGLTEAMTHILEVLGPES